MPATIQHTLINLEIAPPEGSWPAIAGRLDVEYLTGDTQLSQKISDISIAPPDGAWPVVSKAIQEKSPAPEKKASATPVVPFRKIAVAAAITLLLSVGAWYFIFSGNTGSNNNVAVVQSDPSPASPDQQTPGESATDPKSSEVNSRSNNLPDRPLPRRAVPNPMVQFAGRPPGMATAVVTTAYQYDDTGNTLPYAGVEDIAAASTIIPPRVAAPLIRDENGELILDKNLITDDNNRYITVTGPNGEQTRISVKFLHMLESMNTDTRSDEYFDMIFRENILWKIRFREWRNKLLQQASFIPTATNFLDLLELKDILQEQ